MSANPPRSYARLDGSVEGILPQAIFYFLKRQRRMVRIPREAVSPETPIVIGGALRVEAELRTRLTNDARGVRLRRRVRARPAP